MFLSKLVEKLKQGQGGLVDFKITTDPYISAAASLEKAKVDEISFLDNNSPLLEQPRY